jgi:hypothetical protein
VVFWAFWIVGLVGFVGYLVRASVPERWHPGMPKMALWGSLVALAITLSLLVISAFQNSWLTAFWLLFVLALVLLILFLVLRFWAFAFAVALFAVIMLALAVIDTSVTGGNDNSNPSDGTSQSTQPSQPAGNTPTVSQKTLKRLTVDYRNPGFDCARAVRASGQKVVNGVYAYSAYVIEVGKKPGERRWSDAISVPLPGATPAAKKHNLQLAICLQPYVGVVWEHALSTMFVGGHSLLSRNHWMRPTEDVTKVNDLAKRYGALLNLNQVKASAKASAHYVVVNRQWQHRANAINGLLAQFDPTAIRALPSVRNWHAIPLSGTLPEVGLNPRQEKLPALVLNVTQKGACAPLLSVGANVADMRPEVFATPTCKPAPHGTPPGNGGCTGTQCGHQTPGCTTCTPHHPPTSPPPSTHTTCPVCEHHATQQPQSPQPNGTSSDEPSAQPTNPVDTNSPGAPNTGGNNGGSTNNPVPSGPTGTGDPSAPPSSVPTPN